MLANHDCLTSEGMDIIINNDINHQKGARGVNGGFQPRRISKGKRRGANKLLAQLENDVAGYVGRCLFVIDDNGAHCGRPVTNNCHMISESAVLDGLRDNETKRVLELQWGVSQWRRLVFRSDVEQRAQDLNTFDPSERTTGDACTGRFACKSPYDHDGQFQPIDVAEANFDDPVVRLLSGYRLMLFLADQCRQAMELHQRWDQVGLRRRDSGNLALWLAEKGKLNTALQRAEAAVALLGQSWRARETGGQFDPDPVSAKVLKFRSKLRFAGGVSYGKATGVIVFPGKGDRHRMGVLYFTGDSHLAEGDIERLENVAGDSREPDNYGVTVLHELMTSGWGSLALSPGTYKGLNNEERSTIRGLVARHSNAVELVRSAPIKPFARRRRRK